jgi:hypothetical protein
MCTSFSMSFPEAGYGVGMLWKYARPDEGEKHRAEKMCTEDDRWGVGGRQETNLYDCHQMRPPDWQQPLFPPERVWPFDAPLLTNLRSWAQSRPP